MKWTRKDGLQINDNEDSTKYSSYQFEISDFKKTLTVSIKDLVEADFTDYTCTVNSNFGEVQETMKLYGMYGVYVRNPLV